MMTTSRLQLALNVADIDAATAFYRDLFGVEPAKRRPGYANFEIPDAELLAIVPAPVRDAVTYGRPPGA